MLTCSCGYRWDEGPGNDSTVNVKADKINRAEEQGGRGLEKMAPRVVQSLPNSYSLSIYHEAMLEPIGNQSVVVSTLLVNLVVESARSGIDVHFQTHW